MIVKIYCIYFTSLFKILSIQYPAFMLRNSLIKVKKIQNIGSDTNTGSKTKVRSGDIFGILDA